jgi:hypothetical protein
VQLEEGPRARGGAKPGLPWQFLFRASLVIAGLVLLLIVDVRGVVFYFAWGFIVFALVSEAASTLVYWIRARR